MPGGVASFDLLRGPAHEKQVFVWAFERRKSELKTLLKRALFGLALNDYVAGDGPALFAQA